MLAVAIVLVVDLVFGGATQPDAVSSAVARLISLPLLAVALWRLPTLRLGVGGWIAIAILAAIIAVPVIQSIPLPPDVWSGLPGRRSILLDYAAAGLKPPWLPISLTPYETEDVLLWLVPPCAIFFAALGLRGRARLAVAACVPAIAAVAVVLGMLQVLGGEQSPLRFYAYTNLDSAVGFFANRNHEAALLVAGAALAPVWIAIGAEGWLDARAGALIAVVLEIVLVVGIGVTHSRAGVLIGLPVLAIAALITLRFGEGRIARRASGGVLAAAVIGALLVGVFARDALIERFHAPLGEEARVKTMPAVRQAAREVFPVGSGLGSFDPIYRAHEPLEAVTSYYFNHAHNDALELMVETGVSGLAILAAFVVWWIWLSVRVVVSRSSRGSLGALASLVIGGLLVHSLADYPLRTTALASVFALACGLLASEAATKRLTPKETGGRCSRAIGATSRKALEA